MWAHWLHNHAWGSRKKRQKVGAEPLPSCGQIGYVAPALLAVP